MWYLFIALASTADAPSWIIGPLISYNAASEPQTKQKTRKAEASSMGLKRVVVTGMGAVSPNGIGREAFWRNTASGISGYRSDYPVRRFQAVLQSCR
jgi:hypothetical protein